MSKSESEYKRIPVSKEDLVYLSKKEQIEFWTKRPIEVDDYVQVEVPYTEMVTTGKGKSKKTEEVSLMKTGSGYVKEILSTKKYGTVYAIEFNSWSLPSNCDKVVIDGKNYQYQIELLKEEWVKPDFGHCGTYPFQEEPPRVNFYNRDIDSLLCDCGYKRDFNNIEINKIGDHGKDESSEDRPLIGCSYGGVNFDPFVKDKDNNKQFFQRGLVWTEAQKQALIESIYNWIEIGKFVFRYKSWPQLVKEMKENGHGFNWDCVDGKQRMNAIIEFVQNKFPDLHGNYWDDLSKTAQMRFLRYDRLGFAKLEEGTTDANVIRVFLTLNFTGVPMSPDHIKFVQSIKM